MLLTYILSFSLLIMSVIKVADLFIKIDHSLKEKRSEFVKQTKKTHQDGNITLFALLLILMITSLLMFFTLKFKVELKEARYRKESYLCFHYLNVETQNYIHDMSKLNWGLRSAFAATFTGVATAQAKVTFDALKILRNGRHFYYIKNLLSNKYCTEKTASLSYLKNFPYKVTKLFTLVTNPDETSILREAQWSTTYYKNPTGIRYNKSFCLKATMSAEGSFNPNLQIRTTEISMAGFSQLKCLSSSP